MANLAFPIPFSEWGQSLLNVSAIALKFSIGRHKGSGDASAVAMSFLVTIGAKSKADLSSESPNNVVWTAAKDVACCH
ncbi:hypothetical protein TNCV_3433221 [Trichonephila clavipes]|nr:hypothetical protein TNCV_3433221 [Trichonephila clavipes]